ncbi:MAG TPA: hypothetical protein VGN69_04785 [Solirubrobacteraceae bacterium]|jgi:hypothetical protein|nr:hypothetical protein [Solirubrobacteraceae bacterium]
MRFGPAGALRPRPDPVRLTPLPSAGDPQVVFLGVLRGGRRASFLLSSRATATGDGRCRPSPSSCQVLDLAPGETEFLDVRDPARGLVQYELDLVGIGARHLPNRVRAVRLRRRESHAGRRLVNGSASPALSHLTYSVSLGALVTRLPPVPRAGSTPTRLVAPSAAAALPFHW